MFEYFPDILEVEFELDLFAVGPKSSLYEELVDKAEYWKKQVTTVTNDHE